MTIPVSVAPLIDELCELVRVGDKPKARSVARTLLGRADARELALVNRIAQVLRDRPRTAVALLRQMWRQTTDPTERAIIVACAPEDGDTRAAQPSAPDRAPAWTRPTMYQAPGTVSTSRSDAARRAPRTSAQTRAEANSARYGTERAGVQEGAQILTREERDENDKVYASGFDYDRLSLIATEAPRCIGCFIDRDPGQLDRARIAARHGDDGLCFDCREKAVPGIPPLPTTHTTRDAIIARCATLTNDLPAPGALRYLATEWRKAPSLGAQHVIAEFAEKLKAAHCYPPLAPEAPQVTAPGESFGGAPGTAGPDSGVTPHGSAVADQPATVAVPIPA